MFRHFNLLNARLQYNKVTGHEITSVYRER